MFNFLGGEYIMELQRPIGNSMMSVLDCFLDISLPQPSIFNISLRYSCERVDTACPAFTSNKVRKEKMCNWNYKVWSVQAQDINTFTRNLHISLNSALFLCVSLLPSAPLCLLAMCSDLLVSMIYATFFLFFPPLIISHGCISKSVYSFPSIFSL